MNDSGPQAYEYEVTLEDAIAFALHHHAHSPTLRARRRILRLGLTLIFALFAATLGGVLRAPVIASTGLLLALGFWFVFPRRYQQGLRDNTRRMYGEGRNLGVLGPSTLRIGDDFLTEETPMREVRTRWAAVEGCVQAPEHLFLYVTGSTALIVPRRALTDAQAETLCAEVDRRMRTARAS